MKRALLIAGGTVGGLGAVLAITPPQISGSSALNIAGAPVAAISAPASSSSAAGAVAVQGAATATKSAKPVATKKAAAATASATTNKTATASASTTATASTSASASTTATATPSHSVAPAAATTAAAVAKSGTFTGPAIFVNYGTVQVKITVANGHITDAVAVQAPSGRNDRYTQMAVPILKQQTLAAQSANIKGASGASYTSYGWAKSLQGALADAGL